MTRITAVLFGGVIILVIVAFARQSVRFVDRARAPANSADHEQHITYGWPASREASDPAQQQPSSDASSRRLHGVTVDEQGAPLPGARVAVLGDDGQSMPISSLEVAIADSAGAFSLRMPEEGDSKAGWCLCARRDGFIPARATVDGRPFYTLTLTPGERITGRVVTAGDLPARGVRVVARGLAVAVEGRRDTFPAAHSQVQAATTDADGTFALSGLEGRWHLISVYEPGLVVAPGRLVVRGGKAAFVADDGRQRHGRSGAVIAESGSAGVVIRVLPVGVIKFRAVDARTGLPVPSASYGVVNLGGFVPWPGVQQAEAGIVVSDGRTVSVAQGGLSRCVRGKLLIADSWPIREDATVEVRVYASGYESASVPVRVREAGRDQADGWEEIPLEPKDRTGSVRLRLVDRRGAAVGPCRLPVVLRDPAHAKDNYPFRADFDDSGTTEVMAVPCGRFVVGAALRGAAPPHFEEATVEIGEQQAEVTLTLACGAAIVAIENEAGRALDDVGIRVGPGYGPVKQELQMVEHGEALVGSFVVSPGKGKLVPQAYVGYSAGPWTFEAYRHGYEPKRLVASLELGVCSRVLLQMTPSSEAIWDAWSDEVEVHHAR